MQGNLPSRHPLCCPISIARCSVGNFDPLCAVAVVRATRQCITAASTQAASGTHTIMSSVDEAKELICQMCASFYTQVTLHSGAKLTQGASH